MEHALGFICPKLRIGFDLLPSHIHNFQLHHFAEQEQVIYLLLPNVALQSEKMQSLKYVSSVSTPVLNLSYKGLMAIIYLFAIVLIMT